MSFVSGRGFSHADAIRCARGSEAPSGASDADSLPLHNIDMAEAIP